MKNLIYNPVTQYLATQLWHISEGFCIPLGSLAPFVFGLMMGQPGEKQS